MTVMTNEDPAVPELTEGEAWYDTEIAPKMAEPVRVPEGFALVPVEPTEAMLTAARRDCSGIGGGSCGEYIGVAGSDFAWVWEVMLSAAQAAQPEPQRVMFNGLTEAETLGTASVAGLTEPQRAVTGEWLYSRWWAIYGHISNITTPHPYYAFSELPPQQQEAHNMLAAEIAGCHSRDFGVGLSDEHIVTGQCSSGCHAKGSTDPGPCMNSLCPLKFGIGGKS